ncbi:MAG: hypothetical protein M3Q97_09065 [Bacteroidota bacterium]|nr:hypothetical protein [Bacteroidota bacterium]
MARDNKNNEGENINPKLVTDNPDYQASGRHTDHANIENKGHNLDMDTGKNMSGPEGNANKASRQISKKEINVEDNAHPNLENKRNTNDENNQSARPQDRETGHDDLTNVKNSGMTEAHTQGQQQGGNHGGGNNVADKRFGNQSTKNSSIEQQRDTDGDLPGGRKGKK